MSGSAQARGATATSITRFPVLRRGVQVWLWAWGAVAVLAMSGEAAAHEHWVTVDAFYPAAGDRVAALIHSGHYFPKKGHSLSEKVMRGMAVRSPGGEVADIDLTPGDKEWSGAMVPAAEGAHVLTFTLRRARAPKPSYEGRAIVVAGPRDPADRDERAHHGDHGEQAEHGTRAVADDPAAYVLGSGLELVPLSPVSRLDPGDELPVQLLLDGVPVAAEVTVVPEKGRSATVEATPEQPARVRIRESGRHLLAASVGGRGCSLVIEVRGREEDIE